MEYKNDILVYSNSASSGMVGASDKPKANEAEILLFETSDSGSETKDIDDEALFQLQQALDEQGFTGKTIDFVKSIFGFGSAKLKRELMQVKSGELEKNAYEEHIQQYSENQEFLVNGLGNFAAGGAGAVAGGAVLTGATISFPVVLAALGVGALAGAVSKFSVSFLGDEATNNIKGDSVFSAGVKDLFGGAVIGATAAGMNKVSSVVQTKLTDSGIKYCSNPRHYRPGWEYINKISAACSSNMTSAIFSSLFVTSGEALIDNESVGIKDFSGEVIENIIPFGDLVDFEK
ncbi:MAG: hypothetical protein E7Z88_00925 [Cyanobacteria bacterium SIG27]|nr:hypothetical protein [Cyanobacteria bacterium SIG27]